MAYIYLHLHAFTIKNHPNVGRYTSLYNFKYTSPMAPMGLGFCRLTRLSNTTKSLFSCENYSEETAEVTLNNGLVRESLPNISLIQV